MKLKIFIYIVFAFLYSISHISAQDSDMPSVLITTYSVTQIPADAIYFSITLSSQNDEPKIAFEDHKLLEKSLVGLLKAFEIADSNISYSLLYIGKAPAYPKETLAYKTRQLVGIRLNDFSKYEPLQLKLLSKGIFEYNAKFVADDKEVWIERGIQEAILKARTEAELAARSSGKKLGEIIYIETSHYYPSDAGNALAVSGLRPGETLIDLPHLVEMSVSLRARFELLEK